MNLHRRKKRKLIRMSVHFSILCQRILKNKKKCSLCPSAPSTHSLNTIIMKQQKGLCCIIMNHLKSICL